MYRGSKWRKGILREGERVEEEERGGGGGRERERERERVFVRLTDYSIVIASV